MGRSLIVLLVCALAHEAQAQSPRAGGPAAGDSAGEEKIAAEVNIAGNIARGFVDRELIASRGIVQGWTGPWGVYLQPYWLYGRVGTPAGKLTTDNEIYIRTGVFREIENTRFFAYAVSVWDRSLRRKIDYRDLTGAGFGIHLLRDKGISLLTSFGVLGQVTSFKDRTLVDPDGPGTFEAENRRWTAHWSARIYGRYKIAGGKLALTHDFIYVPTFEDPRDDYRILIFGAVEAPIAKGFAIRAQADATYEGLIVAGTKHGDLAITFGINYKNEWTKKKPAPPPTAPPAIAPSPTAPTAPSPTTPTPTAPTPTAPPTATPTTPPTTTPTDTTKAPGT